MTQAGSDCEEQDKALQRHWRDEFGSTDDTSKF